MGVRDRVELMRSKDLTLGTFMERLGAVHGQSPLVVEVPDGLRLTFAEAADRVARIAGTLAGKVQPGDRVVVSLPNGYGIFLASLAVARAGGVAVPVNPKMRPDEIEHVVNDSNAAFSIDDLDIYDDGPTLDDAVAVDQKDVAVLFYTSGTTGKPKGAELTHRALVGSAGGSAGFPNRVIRMECVTGMPVAHVAGFTLLIQMAALGVPIALLTKFRPDTALDTIERRRSTMFVGVPAMYRMMQEAGAADRDLSSVRVWSSAADVMPPEVAREFQSYGAAVKLPLTGKTLGRATFIDGYGMVELGGGAAIKVMPPVGKGGDGLVRPIRGNKLKVVDDAGSEVAQGEVGELVVKGPGVMRGYHGKSDETSAAFTPDGWLRTGDLARARPGGFFEFAGRKKDVIKHGGYSVFAVEVEATLEEHPDVLEAAVVGLPDDRKGEVPAAAVRIKAGSSLDGDALVAWAKERLSDYKAPTRVLVVDELPRTGTDKVHKASVKELF